MLTYQVISPKLAEVKPLDEDLVCEEIERMVGRHELEAPQRMTLSSKKGSYHWHFKKGKEKGVLEVTYWPKRSELLVEIHDNRRTEWNLALIETLAQDFAEYFGGMVEKG